MQAPFSSILPTSCRTDNSIGIYALKDEDVAEAFQDNYKLNDGSLVDTVEKARLYFEEYEQYRSVTT